MSYIKQLDQLIQSAKSADKNSDICDISAKHVENVVQNYSMTELQNHHVWSVRMRHEIEHLLIEIKDQQRIIDNYKKQSDEKH